jgi:hypothetical protein
MARRAMAPPVNGPVVILAATRDRAAVGRGVVGLAVAAVFGGGLLISQLGGVAATVAHPWPPVRAEDGQLVVPAAANGQCFVDIQINESTRSPRSVCCAPFSKPPICALAIPRRSLVSSSIAGSRHATIMPSRP